METKEYRTVDKTKWGAGPWQNEPDKVQWQDEVTGLPCLIVRGPVGSWCGYVGVNQGHSLYLKDYDEAEVSVHGGLTFSNKCEPDANEEKGICHVAGEGETDYVWWFGFDCAHSHDYCPAYAALPSSISWRGGDYAEYKDMEYVKRQVKTLASQLAGLAS